MPGRVLSKLSCEHQASVVFSRGIELRLCLADSGLALLSSFPEHADESAESLVDLSAFLVHIAVECLSPDHPAEIAQRKDILEENTDLFADVVIKLPHDIRICRWLLPSACRRYAGPLSSPATQPWEPRRESA